MQMFPNSSKRNLSQYFLFQAYPEDEHELIAAYAQQLANAPDAKNMEAMSSHSRNLVRELERKNREIMRDIHHLKRAHRNQRIMQLPPGADPSIVTELEVCKLEWGSNQGYYFTAEIVSGKNARSFLVSWVSNEIIQRIL